jgi:hypothetical protein
MSVRNGTSIADDVRAICIVVDGVVDDSSGRDGALNGVERMLSAANRAVVRVHL